MKILILTSSLLTGCAGNQVLLKKPTSKEGHPPIEQIEYQAADKEMVFNIIPWVTCIFLLASIFYLFCRNDKSS